MKGRGGPWEVLEGRGGPWEVLEGRGGPWRAVEGRGGALWVALVEGADKGFPPAPVAYVRHGVGHARFGRRHAVPSVGLSAGARLRFTLGSSRVRVRGSYPALGSGLRCLCGFAGRLLHGGLCRGRIRRSARSLLAVSRSSVH